MGDLADFMREQAIRDEALRQAFVLLTDAIRAQTDQINLLRDVITTALGEVDEA